MPYQVKQSVPAVLHKKVEVFRDDEESSKWWGFGEGVLCLIGGGGVLYLV